MKSDQRTRTETNTSTFSPEEKAKIEEWQNQTFTEEDLPKLVEAINSNDKFQQLYGTIGVRRLSGADSCGGYAPEVASFNIASKLLDFTKRSEEPELQNEAVWTLGNLAGHSSEQAQLISELGGIEQFVSLLRSPHKNIVEHAILTLGNLAGENEELRDQILQHNGIKALLEVLPNMKDNIQNGMWVLSNLCKGKPRPSFELVKDIIPFAVNVLSTESNVNVLCDAAWSLYSLFQTSGDYQAVIPMEAIPAILKHIDSGNMNLKTACLRTVGNIIARTEDQAFMALNDPKFIPKLFQLLNHKNRTLRKDTCWVLSNITAGTSEQIELVLNYPPNVRTLIEIATEDVEEVSQEAVCVLANVTLGCNEQQLTQLLANGAFEVFIRCLSSSREPGIISALEAISRILHRGKLTAEKTGQSNTFLEALEKHGGLEKIQELQTHPSEEVSINAVQILKEYFGVEENS